MTYSGASLRRVIDRQQVAHATDRGAVKAHLGTLEVARCSQLLVAVELLYGGSGLAWLLWCPPAAMCCQLSDLVSSPAAAHCNGKGCSHFCTQNGGTVVGCKC